MAITSDMMMFPTWEGVGVMLRSSSIRFSVFFSVASISFSTDFGEGPEVVAPVADAWVAVLADSCRGDFSVSMSEINNC